MKKKALFIGGTGTITVGAFKKLAREDMEAIYKLARA